MTALWQSIPASPPLTLLIGDHPHRQAGHLRHQALPLLDPHLKAIFADRQAVIRHLIVERRRTPLSRRIIADQPVTVAHRLRPDPEADALEMNRDLGRALWIGHGLGRRPTDDPPQPDWITIPGGTSRGWYLMRPALCPKPQPTLAVA